MSPVTHLTAVVVRDPSLAKDIAIDDIKFKNCNARAAPPTIDCSFELNTCSWKQDPYDQFDWLRNNGSTASKNTGPVNDHTKGDSSGKCLRLSGLLLAVTLSGYVILLYSPIYIICIKVSTAVTLGR